MKKDVLSGFLQHRNVEKSARFFCISLCLFALAACPTSPLDTENNGTTGTTADHRVIHELWDGRIPEEKIQQAKDVLHIAYGHTSHGSQVTDGMT
ncbi:MAG: hypothetical protein JW760_15055, partial [Spirochaetales bacterium]|nr:hypothetical protein [Spirochaetales bacterium]